MGMGDFKLALLLGAMLGWAVVTAIFIGSIAGALVAIGVLVARGSGAHKQTIFYWPVPRRRRGRGPLRGPPLAGASPTIAQGMSDSFRFTPGEDDSLAVAHASVVPMPVLDEIELLLYGKGPERPPRACASHAGARWRSPARSTTRPSRPASRR
jgi:hypothetical protein